MNHDTTPYMEGAALRLLDTLMVCRPIGVHVGIGRDGATLYLTIRGLGVVSHGYLYITEKGRRHHKEISE